MGPLIQYTSRWGSALHRGLRWAGWGHQTLLSEVCAPVRGSHHTAQGVMQAPRRQQVAQGREGEGEKEDGASGRVMMGDPG